MKPLICLLAALSLAHAQQSGRQTSGYRVSGTVVDHVTNHPLKNVLVELTPVGKGHGEASALTEEDGRFNFLNVPKGKYNLQAQKRGQFPQAFHASDGGFSTALVVDGQLKVDDLVFPLHSDSFITGTVTGDDGEPVRNASVHLFRESVTNGEAQTQQRASANTNGEGQFHLGHLEPGKYFVAVSGFPWFNTGMANEQQVFPITYYGDTTDANAAKAIILAEGASASISIQMHAVPTIRVKLPDNRQGLSLSVLGPGGAHIPIPTSIISNVNQQGGFIRSGAIQLPPQDQEPAEEELTNIPAGRYLVQSVGQNGEGGQNAQTVDLSDGSTLSFGSNPGNNSVVNGRIIFDTPRPTGELHVFLSGAGRGVEADVATDGSFKFDRLTSGAFSVNMDSSSPLVTTSMQAKGGRMVHDQVEVPAGATVDLLLHMQSAESMVKIDGFAMRGDKGIAGAMVLLLPKDAERAQLIRRDQSDADGSFTLANILPGQYTLLAIDDGTDLAYRDAKLIQPYLDKGLSITIPLKNPSVIRVPVQTRKQ